MKLNRLSCLLPILCIILLTACSKSGTPTATTEGNSSSSAAKETAPQPTPDPKDPKTICAYLNDLELYGDGYKADNYGGYRCTNNKNIMEMSDGRLVKISYDANGDDATKIKSLSIDLDCDGRADSDKADDFMVKASDELWQKVFGKPLPDELKSSLLAGKGKKGKSKKTVTEPVYASAEREPWPGGTGYKLMLYISLPHD
jgi:hypothetical protein